MTAQTWKYPGAQWWKVDFHTHTPASTDTAWYPLIGEEGELTPEGWLQKYMDAGIDCVVISDHNSGAWIDRLKAAYAEMMGARPAGFRELFLFPGVELSVNGGIHILAVFDLEAATDDINTLLARVEYEGTKGKSDGVTRCSLIQVIEIIDSLGALAIPAHADKSKGLLELAEADSARPLRDPNTLQHVFDCGKVLAVEIVDRATPKPQIYTQSGCEWVEVIGSDCHSFRGPNVPGSRFTWVKMERPSLEGLRLALMDGERFSVRRSDDADAFDPTRLPEHFIESIEISNARFMGRGRSTTISFSPWFNAVVGGRGTGKSTVVHALRLAYQRQAELVAGTEAERTFSAFAQVPQSRSQGGLQTETTIKVSLQRDRVAHRLYWRQDAGATSVKELIDGKWQESEAQVVSRERFPLRLFSQGQIASLAGEDQRALLSVIDEAAECDPAKAVLEEEKRHLFALAAQMRELQSKLQSRTALMIRLKDVERKLQRFEEAQHAEVLGRYQTRIRQTKEVTGRFDHARVLAERLQNLSQELEPRPWVSELFDPSDEQNRDVLEVVQRLEGSVHEAVESIRNGERLLRERIEQEAAALRETAWQGAVDQTQADYQALVDMLKEQGVATPSAYGNLVQERQQVTADLQRLDDIQTQLDRLNEEYQEQTRAVLYARRTLSAQRRDFLQQTLAHNPYVRIELLPYRCDVREIERSLREVLGMDSERRTFADELLVIEGGRATEGLIASLVAEVPEGRQAGLEMEERIEALKNQIERGCTDGGEFGARFTNFLRREYSKRVELLDHLAGWFPEDGLEIKYSRSGDGRHFQSIVQASAGQRAAAMLAFLLAHGTDPLVLDQPEDDLDNYLIYDLIVRQIRANKLRRQIITITHNPNIVVNGDAEMLHALDFSGGQCRVALSGSLQEPEMRTRVCDVMEGGAEAFQRRYRRLSQRI